MTRPRLLLHAWVQLLLVAGIAAAATHLAAAWPVRLDVTGDQRHHLAPASIAAVAHLDEPLTATVWFTADLDPPHHRHRQALLDLLAELEAHSQGQLDVVLKDPSEDPETARAAARAGIRPITLARTEWDQTVARQVWMGLSFDQGTRHAAVDALPRIDRMEREVLRALLRTTTPEEARRTVGWLRGDGEPPLRGWPAGHPMEPLVRGLAARHDLVEVDGAEPIPDAVDALLLIGPQRALPPDTQARLDAFLMRGGALALFLSSWQPDFDRMEVRPVPHGLEPLLATWGVRLGGDLLLDRSRNDRMALPAGGRLLQLSHPLAPVSTAFDRSAPPVRDLRQAALPFATSVHPAAGPALEAQVWLRTEPTAVATRALDRLEPEAAAAPLPDERPGPHPVVVALQGRFSSHFPDQGTDLGAPTRLVVAGSADLVANHPELVLNAVDWLLDDPRLATIRARGRAPPALVRPASPRRWKLAVGGGPLGLLLGLTALGAWRRRAR